MMILLFLSQAACDIVPLSVFVAKSGLGGYFLVYIFQQVC